MQYILDDLHGEGRNTHIDPQDTLMRERERASESDDAIAPLLDTMTDLLDTIIIPPREHDK